MAFNPVLVLLLVLLMGLLALSLGYRRDQSAAAPVRRTVEVLRGLAKRNPDRYGPALALHLRLLAIELLESGRPAQALLTVMGSVDLYRALERKYPGRFTADLRDSVDIEDVLKQAVGFDPAVDLHALAEAEDFEETDENGPPRRRAAFAWTIALIVWTLSVLAFVAVALGQMFTG